jgi:hypothetical protein
MGKPGIRTFAALAVCGALAIGTLYAPPGAAQELKKQYWATSLSRSVDDVVLQGLYEAVARGEVGWLDIDPKYLIRPLRPGINLILYHVGGNCYIGDDCDRFPDSQSTGDRWGSTERAVDLDDPEVRKIVVEDLVAIVRSGDEVAPEGAIVGVHLDNVHKLDAQGLADIFNEFLTAVEAARQQGRISKNRKIGYVAKNNPSRFKRALDENLLTAPPLYQINENARLDADGVLDRQSQTAGDIGRRCRIPVFLKTFGSDVAFKGERDGSTVYVTQSMARQMAQAPDISGVAWSADERSYRPTLFVQGSPVRQTQFGSANRCDG